MSNMARTYDREVFDAKDYATQCLLRLTRLDTKGRPLGSVDEMADALDLLNKAWDALLDCIVRQREERDRQILMLIDELAEAKKTDAR